jgi:protein SCO1/2
MRMSPGQLALLSILAAAALATGYVLHVRQQQPAAVTGATVLATPRPLPAFSLTQASGQPFTRENLRGGWHLLFFGYTHCPDVCPNTLGLLHAVSAALKQRGRPDLGIVFISVDPGRDRPEVLGPYVRYFDPGFLAATGPDEQLEKLTRALYIPYSRDSAGSDGNYEVQHSGALVLLNADAQAVAYFSPPLQLDALVAGLQQLMHR